VKGFLSVRLLEEKRKNFNFEEKKEKENAEVKEDTAIAAS